MVTSYRTFPRIETQHHYNRFNSAGHDIKRDNPDGQRRWCQERDSRELRASYQVQFRHLTV